MSLIDSVKDMKTIRKGSKMRKQTQLDKFEKGFFVFSTALLLSVSVCAAVFDYKENNNIEIRQYSEDTTPNIIVGQAVDNEEEKADKSYNVYHIDGMNTKIMHTTSSSCVRNSPTAKGEMVGTIRKGQDVSVTGICTESGWYRIDYGDNCAFISNEYVDNGSAVVSAEKPDSSNLFVRGEEGVSDAMVLAVEREYLMIPENVRTYLQNSGWTITISAQNLKERYRKDGDTIGIIVYNKSEILIDNREVAESAVIHEVGHFIDYEENRISESEEFVNIYESEKDAYCEYRFTAEHNTSESNEYFAEAFLSCVCDPVGMKNACPQTYAYIMNIIQSL